MADKYNMKLFALIVTLVTFGAACNNTGSVEVRAKIRESITVENGEKPRNLRVVYEYPNENQIIEKMYSDNRLADVFEHLTSGSTTYQYLNGKFYSYTTTVTTGDCKTETSYYEYSIQTNVTCEDGSSSHVRRGLIDNMINICSNDLAIYSCKKLKNGQLVSQYSEDLVTRVVRNIDIIGADQAVTETHFIVQFENEHEARAKMYESNNQPNRSQGETQGRKFVGTWEATEYAKGARTTTFYDTQGKLISTYQNIL